jgi:hypothetical protein
MTALTHHTCILSIYSNRHGFGFVVFEGHLAPVDWGIAWVRGRRKNRECVRRISALLGRHNPAALVIRQISERMPRRIRDLNEGIAALAETQGISVFAYSRMQVRECFGYLGAPTKQYIAEVIAKHIPAFERHLPPARRAWDAEDPRMGLFDAAAVALTFFHKHGAEQPSAA